MAYIDAYTKYSKDDVWKHLPRYFVDNRNAMAAATNPLIHFLASGKLRINDECEMPEGVHQHFNAHFRRQQLLETKIQSRLLHGAVHTVWDNYKRITIFTGHRKVNRVRRRQNGTAFVGVDVIAVWDVMTRN